MELKLQISHHRKDLIIKNDFIFSEDEEFDDKYYEFMDDTTLNESKVNPPSKQIKIPLRPSYGQHDIAKSYQVGHHPFLIHVLLYV